MYTNQQNSHKLLFAFLLCGILTLVSLPAEANTLLTITSFPSGDITVGPYLASLTIDGTTTNPEVFCLDKNLITYLGQTYAGAVHNPDSPQEKEAAFLASYSLFLGAPSSDAGIVANVESPITEAIWQIMGTLPIGTPPDSKRSQYIALAEAVYQGLPASFLSQVQVFNPDDTSAQRFITSVRDDAMIASATPEPGTWLSLVTGIGLIALSRRRSRC